MADTNEVHIFDYNSVVKVHRSQLVCWVQTLWTQLSNLTQLSSYSKLFTEFKQMVKTSNTTAQFGAAIDMTDQFLGSDNKVMIPVRALGSNKTYRVELFHSKPTDSEPLVGQLGQYSKLGASRRN